MSLDKIQHDIQTVAIGKDHVAKYQIEFAILTLEDFPCFPCTGSRDRRITALRQDCIGKVAYAVFIFDQKYSLSVAHCPAEDFIFLPVIQFSEVNRQVDFKNGTLAGFAIDVDPAIMFFDNSIDYGQPQPSSLFLTLGTEKRLKNLPYEFFRNSNAVILNGELNEIALLRVRIILEGCFGNADVFGFND